MYHLSLSLFKITLDKRPFVCYVINMMNIVELEKRIDNGEKFGKNYIRKVVRDLHKTYYDLRCVATPKDPLRSAETVRRIACRRTIIKLKQARK